MLLKMHGGYQDFVQNIQKMKFGKRSCIFQLAKCTKECEKKIIVCEHFHTKIRIIILVTPQYII